MISLNLKNPADSSRERVLQRQSILIDYLEKKKSTSNKNQEGDVANHLDYSNFFEINKIDINQVEQKNCENLMGSVETPVGVAGPASIQLTTDGGEPLQQELFIPLATTEGALVASVSRGLKALGKTNRTKVCVKKIGMTRAPVFGFPDHLEAKKFVDWLENKDGLEKIRQACEKTSQHLKLKDCQTWVVGRVVYVRFIFDTDQAMGMNMVTLALGQAWREIISSYSNIELISLSGNMCVDKKPSAVNRLLGRGYGVQIETLLNKKILQAVLKVSVQEFYKAYYWKNVVGSSLAGTDSFNMHAANMVAGLFLATGQDMAHVAECSQASLLVEQKPDDSLYIALTMPNINVGVVGGGSGLTPFYQARKLIFGREITAEELAGVVAVAVLSGELSGLAALATQSLACAHQKLAR